MNVWLSEFTYQRLIDGLGQKIPVIHTDEHGFVRVDLSTEIVKNATQNFGVDIDHAINEMINDNQRRGLWPKKEKQ